MDCVGRKLEFNAEYEYINISLIALAPVENRWLTARKLCEEHEMCLILDAPSVAILWKTCSGHCNQAYDPLFLT